jgi:hypothetical protein
VSGPIFMFCAPVLIFGCTVAPGPHFMFCAPRLIFNITEGVRSIFHVLRSQTHLRWYRGCHVHLLCFALSDSFLTLPRALSPVFIFCTPGLIFGGTEGNESLINILRYRLISGGTEALGQLFMFCAPGLVFSYIECVWFTFHVLHSRARLRRYRGCWFPFSCITLSG